MPTCGKCKRPNVSSTSIRACYNGEPAPHALAEEPAVLFVQPKVATQADEEALAAVRLAQLTKAVPQGETDDSPLWPASEAQIAYVLDILQPERRLPADYKVKTREDLAKMEKDEVSSTITMLKAFPRKDGKQDSQRDYGMPEGKYALEVNGEVWFFQVDKPTKGRWAGYTFIKRLVGAPGSYRKLPMTPHERNKYLAKIDADPKAAAILFGQKAGRCFRCMSPLTDPDSLARSMGPICAGKVGW